jgi:YhcH/YjgK/YiaL family protein
MIATPLGNLGRYRTLSPRLAKAISWLETGGWEKLPEGRHEIAGTEVYALVSRYTSKAPEEARYETHRDYIDIQLVVSGRETVEARSSEGLEVSVPYKPDIEFFAFPEPGTCHEFLLAPGTALIFFPEDAHRPGLARGGVKEPIHKVVVKVAV